MMEPLRHRVLYVAEAPVLEITGWLEENCEGEWSVEVDDDAFDEAKVKILFEFNNDKLSFIKDFV